MADKSANLRRPRTGLEAAFCDKSSLVGYCLPKSWSQVPALDREQIHIDV